MNRYLVTLCILIIALGSIAECGERAGGAEVNRADEWGTGLDLTPQIGGCNKHSDQDLLHDTNMRESSWWEGNEGYITQKEEPADIITIPSSWEDFTLTVMSESDVTLNVSWNPRFIMDFSEDLEWFLYTKQGKYKITPRVFKIFFWKVVVLFAEEVE